MHGNSGAPVKSKQRTCVQLWEIFLPSVGAGVGSRYVHYICESVPMLPITFSLKGQCKPCWNTPLKTASLSTAVSQNPKGCIYLQTLPFAFLLIPVSHALNAGYCLFFWGAAAEGREVLKSCWRFLSFPCHCQHTFSPAWCSSEVNPEMTGQDPPWGISRNNRLLMVGSWAAMG